MRKNECDIIRDLLPSYVDEVCSDASRMWIEEHLQECEECRKTKELLQQTEISGEKLSGESFEAAKKIKRSIIGKSLIGYGIGVLIFIFILMVCKSGNTDLPSWFFAVCLPAYAIWYFLLSMSQPKTRKWSIQETVGVLAAALILIGGIGVMYFGIFYAAKNAIQTGPFMDSCFIAAALLFIAGFLWQAYKNIRLGRGSGVMINLCLTGLFLMLSYHEFLGEVTDFEAVLESLKRINLTILLNGAICIFATEAPEGLGLLSGEK